MICNYTTLIFIGFIRVKLHRTYLQYVAHLERYARLGAGYKLIIQRIIIELGAHEYLRVQGRYKINQMSPNQVEIRK